MLRRMHAYRAPAFGRVARIDGGGTPPATTCEQAHLELTGEHRHRRGRDTPAADALLHAALDPRTEYGVVHSELCAEHTLVRRG